MTIIKALGNYHLLDTESFLVDISHFIPQIRTSIKTRYITDTYPEQLNSNPLSPWSLLFHQSSSGFSRLVYAVETKTVFARFGMLVQERKRLSYVESGDFLMANQKNASWHFGRCATNF